MRAPQCVHSAATGDFPTDWDWLDSDRDHREGKDRAPVRNYLLQDLLSPPSAPAQSPRQMPKRMPPLTSFSYRELSIRRPSPRLPKIWKQFPILLPSSQAAGSRASSGQRAGFTRGSQRKCVACALRTATKSIAPLSDTFPRALAHASQHSGWINLWLPAVLGHPSLQPNSPQTLHRRLCSSASTPAARAPRSAACLDGQSLHRKAVHARRPSTGAG